MFALRRIVVESRPNPYCVEKEECLSRKNEEDDVKYWKLSWLEDLVVECMFDEL